MFRASLKFDEDEENAIYRVVQEGITNAIRHGHASYIQISIKKRREQYPPEHKG